MTPGTEKARDLDALTRWHSMSDVARMFGVTTAAVSQWCAKWQIEAVRFGNLELLHDEDIAFIDARRKARR